MDRPRAHSKSSPPLLQSFVTSNQQSPFTSVQTESFDDKRASHGSPSRQQRLLQSRNARFPAKRLSISGLSNKLTQLTNNEDQISGIDDTFRNKENTLHKSKSTGTIGKRVGLGILEEISNITRAQSSRQPPDIPIYQDCFEESFLQAQQIVLKSPSAEVSSDPTSPTGFNRDREDSSIMRLREISLNACWPPADRSLSLARAKPTITSSQTNFDTEEYIEHIEKELQQVRDEAYSPLTRRPMKEKLRVANKENERLQKELALLREKFETEVKKTVEHKTVTEVELKRKVRDLEDSLEEKEATIRELQCHHEEKRLEFNVIETLKATIDRLEQDKLDLEEINLGMTKRNEVLTQLLAMSPTRTPNEFILGSPTREKRNARPISLIIPRQRYSPKHLDHSSSIVCSPRPLNSADISPLKLSPNSYNTDMDIGSNQKPGNDNQQLDLEQADRALRSPFFQESTSRRWTLLSDVSGFSINYAEEPKAGTRKKTRKFMAGSTQLKPLLLPTLASDNIPSVTTSSSSPQSWLPDESTDLDPDQTILAEGPGPALPQTAIDDQDEFMQQDASIHASFCKAATKLTTSTPSSFAVLDVSNQDRGVDRQCGARTHTERYSESGCSSMQAMPMPSTPESLAAIPSPLFSPVHRDAIAIMTSPRARSGSVSPATPANAQLNFRKRRKSSLYDFELGSPVLKVHRRRIDHTSAHHRMLGVRSPDLQPCESIRSEDSKLLQQLQKVRSCDNFVEILRRRNFAAKPLAGITIRTIYNMLASCTAIVRDVRRDPFALARRVLANAWRMQWAILGKLSWWVLGLFIQPHNSRGTRAPIDWDQYDGESIANKHCSSFSHNEDDHRGSSSPEHDEHSRLHSYVSLNQNVIVSSESPNSPESKKQTPSWARSLLLWGKFSTALIFAVRGAFIKGPGEMLKDTELGSKTSSPRHRSSTNPKLDQSKASRPRINLSQTGTHRDPGDSIKDHKIEQSCELSLPDPPGSFEFRCESQLNSSSLLDQIQEHSCESTERLDKWPQSCVTKTFGKPRSDEAVLYQLPNNRFEFQTLHSPQQSPSLNQQTPCRNVYEASPWPASNSRMQS